jgi:hypothetical protein
MTSSEFDADIVAIRVHAILDVVCRITGMGFAAVARVPEDRWIACSIRDEIAFGLFIAPEIARPHGGIPTVISSAEETRFTFRMPLGPL